MRSTVVENEELEVRVDSEAKRVGDVAREEVVETDDRRGGDGDARPHMVLRAGVCVPGDMAGVSYAPFIERLGLSASSAARSKRFVVPSALVDPERAEHTMATLCWSKYDLHRSG